MAGIMDGAKAVWKGPRLAGLTVSYGAAWTVEMKAAWWAA